MLNANNTYFRNMRGIELDNSGVSKAYHAWKQSISNKCDDLEMMYFLWEDEVSDFVDTLHKAGIESFVYTNESTATLDNLCKIALAGCTMQGVCTIIRWSDEEPTEVMGIRFSLNMPKEEGTEIMNKTQKITSQNVNIGDWAKNLTDEAEMVDPIGEESVELVEYDLITTYRNYKGEEIMNKTQKITSQNVNSLKLSHIWPAQDQYLMEDFLRLPDHIYDYCYKDSILDYLRTRDQSDLIELWNRYCDSASEECWKIIETTDENGNCVLISRSADSGNTDEVIQYYDIYYPDCPLSIIIMMDYIARHKQDLGDMEITSRL